MKRTTGSRAELDRLSAQRHVPPGCSLQDIQQRNGYTPPAEPVVAVKVRAPRAPKKATTPRPKTAAKAPKKAVRIPTPPATCSLPDCDKRARIKGMCDPHYDHAYYASKHPPKPRRIIPLCAVTSCQAKSKSRGMCMPHYLKARTIATAVLIENHRDEFEQIFTESLNSLADTQHTSDTEMTG